MLETATCKCKIRWHTYTKYGQKNFTKGTKSDTRNRIYTSLVRPVLEHGSLVWDPHQRVRIQQIEAVQNKAARYVHQDWQRTSSVTSMNEALGWLPLQNRRLVNRLTFMHTTIHGQHGYMLPPYVNQPIRQNRTHHKYTYNLIRAQTDGYLYSYLHKTIKAWNSLPSNISNRIDIDSFRPSLLNDMRSGNVQVVHISIATNNNNII